MSKKEVKIGGIAKEILTSFANITKKQGIRSDYLIASADSKIWTAIYELPEGEISLDEEFALNDVLQFLQLVGMMDEKHKISLDENGVLTIQDKSKKFNYASAPIEIVSPRNRKGEEVFESSEEVTSFIIDENTMGDIKKIMKAIDATDIYVFGKDGKIFMRFENEVTKNDAIIKLEGKSEKDFQVQLPAKKPENVFVLEFLYPGIYQVDLKHSKELDLNIMKFTNTSVVEENGKLMYYMPL
jgi:hypothetical protein